jgi:hypothetical protein
MVTLNPGIHDIGIKISRTGNTEKKKIITCIEARQATSSSTHSMTETWDKVNSFSLQDQVTLNTCNEKAFPD